MNRMLGISSLLITVLTLSACTAPQKNGPSETRTTTADEPSNSPATLSEKFPVPPPPPETPQERIAQTLDEVTPALASDDADARASAEQKLDYLCETTMQSADDVRQVELCRQIASRMDADTPRLTRLAFVRQLGRIGRSESVEPLATLLNNDDEMLRKLALQSLQNNPSQPAREAIEAALAAETSNERKIELIGVLGERGDVASIPALITQAQLPEATVAAAATLTISKFGESRARFALYRIWRNEKSGARDIAESALLKLADDELSQGKKDTAGRLYKDLYQLSRNDSTYFAALRGMARCEGPRILVLLIELMKSDDELSGERAARIALEIPGEVVTLTLSMIMSELPVHVQAVIMEGLASRGDATARAAALNGMKHTDARVRLAAVQTLSALGNDDDLPLLAKSAIEGAEQEREVAVNGLTHWRSAAALEVLLETMSNSDIQKHRQALLEGYLRLAKETKDSNPGELCRLIEHAMSAAQTLQEKKTVLAGLAGVRHIDALMMLELYLGDEELRQGAAVVMLDMARELAPDNRDAALAAVSKVRAAIKDPSILSRADEAEAQIKSGAE